MTMLNTRFDREEFECPCGCGFNTVDAELLKVLTSLRDWYGAAVIINSGARCPEQNKKVGGKPGSQHLVGKAADFVVKGITPSKIQDKLRQLYPNTFGVGQGATFTHLDVRERRADWGY